MGRLNQRQGFLVSAIAHLAILMALATHPPSPPTPMPLEPLIQEPTEPPRAALFAPDPETLREMLRPQPPPPRPVPTPPSAPDRKDRISVGGPSELRQKQLILRRDEDLATPKGTPNAVPAAPAPAVAEPGLPAMATPATRPRQEAAANGRGAPSRTAPEGPSIAGSLRNLDQRLQKTGPQGLATGTGQQMGPLFFDPEGADFTAWMNHFKNEVYRNWIVPQPALLGFRGHVDIEFVVERDGKVSGLRVLKSTGTAALDRAAQNALLGSRFLPLPADFASARITMQGSFYYNEGPQGS